MKEAIFRTVFPSELFPDDSSQMLYRDAESPDPIGFSSNDKVAEVNGTKWRAIFDHAKRLRSNLQGIRQSVYAVSRKAIGKPERMV